MNRLTPHSRSTPVPSPTRHLAVRRWALACVRAAAAFVATWLLFGSSPVLAAEGDISPLPVPAPMCGANGTTMEAPPPLQSPSGDELSAPCSEDLMRLVGATSEQPNKDALWLAQAQVDHAVLLLGDVQAPPLPEFLSADAAPVLAPVEHPLRIYRPPRG